MPEARVSVPANPFRLARVTVAVPVPPPVNVTVVGLTVRPKSSTTTLRVALATSVSGLPEASAVAYVPKTVTK